MAITVETVPDSIPLERVQDMLRSLGIEPRNLRAFRLDPFAITAEVYALNADGHRYITGTGPDAKVAIHQIAIPVVRPES